MDNFHNEQLNQNKHEDILIWALNHGYQLGSDDALNGIYLSNDARLTYIAEQCKKYSQNKACHKSVCNNRLIDSPLKICEKGKCSFIKP